MTLNCAGASVVQPRSYLSLGPIFLEGLFCSNDDEVILECSKRIQVIGLTSCTHFEDVWIQCNGNGMQSSSCCVDSCDIMYVSDTNECDLENGGCEHFCTNLVGSYKCNCQNGYSLAPNGHDCIGAYRDIMIVQA